MPRGSSSSRYARRARLEARPRRARNRRGRAPRTPPRTAPWRGRTAGTPSRGRALRTASAVDRRARACSSTAGARRDAQPDLAPSPARQRPLQHARGSCRPRGRAARTTPPGRRSTSCVLGGLGEIGEVGARAARAARRGRRRRAAARARIRESWRASRSAARRRSPTSRRTRLLSRSEPMPSIAACEPSPSRRHTASHRFEARAADEHTEAHEQRLLRRGEQFVAAVDRVAQRLMARGQVARAAGQQLQMLAETVEHRLRRQHVRSRRGELDRQRQAVEADADLGDRCRVGVGQLELGIDSLRAVDEQRDRRAAGERSRRRRGIGQLQRRDRILALAGDVQRLPARDEHPHPLRGPRESGRATSAASVTCSKLSSTSSNCLSRRWSSSAATTDCPGAD